MTYVEVGDIKAPKGEEDADGVEEISELLERSQVHQRSPFLLDLLRPGEKHNNDSVKNHEKSHDSDGPRIANFIGKLARDLRCKSAVSSNGLKKTGPYQRKNDATDGSSAGRHTQGKCSVLVEV